MNVPGRHVCAVCGRVLDRVEGRGYMHPFGSEAETGDHPAVPVADYEVPVRDLCDFCSADETRWILPVASFVAPLGASGSEGDWAACDPCAELLRRNEWNALLRRFVAAWQHRHDEPPSPEVLRHVRALWRQVRRHTAGPLRELAPPP